MSARSLSLQAGLSPSYVGKLEAGEIEPSVRAFARLAMVLGMSVQEVFFCVITEGLLGTSSVQGQGNECLTLAVI